LDPEALLFPAVVFAAQRSRVRLRCRAAFAVFVEVVDLAAAGGCVASRPDAVGVPGGGGGAGRSGEASRPAQIDHHTCRVDDHPSDLVEQAVRGGFGRVDVVAVAGATHERVRIEPWGTIVVHRCEHFLIGGG
jgi:hypothetical protein